MESAVAQKPDQEKSSHVASAPVNDVTPEASHELGAEAGMPLFLQGGAAANALSLPYEVYEQEHDQIDETFSRIAEPATQENGETRDQAKPLANQISPLVERMPVETTPGVDTEMGAGLQMSTPSDMQQEEEIQAASTDEYITNLASTTPIAFINGLKQANTLVTPLQEQEVQAVDDTLPEIVQPTGLNTVENAGGAEREEFNWAVAEEPIVEVEGPVQQDLPSPTHEQSEVSLFDSIRIPSPPTSGESGGYAQNIRDSIDDLPTSDSVNTSAGARPAVELLGAADLQQNEENLRESEGAVSEELNTASTALGQDFGESNVYPDIETEMLSSDVSVQRHADLSLQEPGEIPQTSPEILIHFNTDAQSQLNEQTAPELQRYEAERQVMQTESEQERLSSLAEIDEETERTRHEQETIQSSARDEVGSYRTQWSEENETVSQDFNDQSSDRRLGVNEDIQAEVDSSNLEVEQSLSQAELDAEAEVTTTETEAERRKTEAENKDEGFWSSAVSAIGDFFDKLKEGLNALFDVLREAVKIIIEAAKTAVNRLIDLARSAIVTLIEAFGEFLKGIVRIALAAFPEIAERITGWIDAAVDTAVSAVNALADALKAIANAILNALGAVLDAILAVYQAFYNLILDGLRFLAVGILEILKGIANLALGFAEMLPKLMGALFEEFVGTDVTQPLPNVERTDQEITQHQSGDLPSNTLTTETSSSAELTAQNELATTNRLTDDQITIDSMLELDQDFLQNLPPISEGGQLEMGGAADPVTTEQLQESVFGGISEESDGNVEEVLPESESETLDQTPDPGFANMSDDEKLDYHIHKMDQDIAPPSTGDAKSTETATEDPGIPYEVKTGRLGIGKRLDFVGRQMLKGMQIFWRQNQTTIYAAMLGILVVGGIVAFFTGGAGLIPLLQLLLQVMTVYFLADALMRIKGHLWDFFSKSWVGEVAQGGAALAKAIAVVISEFVLEYVLKGVGKVLKRIKAMVVATRRGAALARGVSRVTGAVSRGARAVGRTARRAAVGARRAVARGGRFVLRGFRRGGLRGARSLQQVRRRILDIFSFKRVWLEKHGRRIEIWGEFNGKVLLSTGEVVDVDDAGPVGRRGSFADSTGRRRRGVVIDKTGNQFSSRLDGLDDAARRQEYLELNRLDDAAERSARIQGGRQTAINAGLLRRNMDGMSASKRAARGYPPSPGDAAHHMVPSTHGYQSAVDARRILDDVGIDDINHGLNGVFLPPALHGPLHSHRYMDEVLRRLQLVQNLPQSRRKIAAISVLDSIAAEILTGNFPH